MVGEPVPDMSSDSDEKLALKNDKSGIREGRGESSSFAAVVMMGEPRTGGESNARMQESVAVENSHGKKGLWRSSRACQQTIPVLHVCAKVVMAGRSGESHGYGHDETHMYSKTPDGNKSRTPRGKQRKVDAWPGAGGTIGFSVDTAALSCNYL